MKTTALALMSLCFSFASVGCGEAPLDEDALAGEFDDDKADSTASKLSKLQTLLADVRADDRLEFSEIDAIGVQAVRGTLTTRVLKAAKNELELAYGTVDEMKYKPSDVYSYPADETGSTFLKVLYFGMPRDISGLTGSNQSVSEKVSVTATEWSFGGVRTEPISVTLRGTAAKSYTLAFTVFESRLYVRVEAGDSASTVAKKIAAKITALAEEIMQEYDDIKFAKDQDLMLAAIRARAVGNVVKIDLDLDA